MILIDNREKPQVVTPVRKYLTENGIESSVERLESGDFHIVCNNGVYVVIEHKRMPDLVASIKNEALVEQCARMLEEYQHVRLFISGQVAHITKVGSHFYEYMMGPMSGKNADHVAKHTMIDTRRVVGTLSTLQKAGVMVDWWPISGGLGAYLRHTKLAYERHLHESEIVRGRFIYLGKEDGITNALERLCIPGVGRGKAKALSDRFGSLKALANADEASLKEVDGVGSTLARNIIDFFQKEEKPTKEETVTDAV